MLIDVLPYLGPTLPYKFLHNRLPPLLAESPTHTLEEMSSCKIVISGVRHSMSGCVLVGDIV